MIPDDRTAIAAMIRNYKLLKGYYNALDPTGEGIIPDGEGTVAERAEIMSDMRDAAWEAREALRNRLSKSGPVKHEGTLYASHYGELVTIDLATVEDVT